MPASAIARAKKGSYVLLKDGYIVDGSGKRGKTGSVLLNGPVIEKVTYGPLKAKGTVIDCRGKIIAPGFIDMHSHNDWFFPGWKNPAFTLPFTAQGITTFVAGNCGFSFAGFKKDSGTGHLELFTENLFKEGFEGLHWRSLREYFAYIRKKGIRQNVAMLAAHGTARSSIRGFDPTPLSADEMRELVDLLDESLEGGARGISVGLQYEPGIFATKDEMRAMALLAKKRGAVFSAHLRAYTAVSAVYPIRPFGTPHNLQALQEMLDLARETGVSLQLSHLIFVGDRTWRSAERALAMIDRAIDEGLDVKFDIFAPLCGASIINVLLPPWFLADLPRNYTDPRAKRRLAVELFGAKMLIGFSPLDVQLTNAVSDELARYNGMFLGDIAAARGLSMVDTIIDLSRNSNGVARVLMHRYSNPAIIRMLMRHRASLFMTDAWVEPSGFQNPAAYGCFPRFLQLAREGALTLEDAICKMSGGNAERMKIADRGFLKEKLAADVVVFDWDKVRDNTTVKTPDAAPDGIEQVFINGVRVLERGTPDPGPRAGVVLD